MHIISVFNQKHVLQFSRHPSTFVIKIYRKMVIDLVINKVFGCSGTKFLAHILRRNIMILSRLLIYSFVRCHRQIPGSTAVLIFPPTVLHSVLNLWQIRMSQNVSISEKKMQITSRPTYDSKNYKILRYILLQPSLVIIKLQINQFFYYIINVLCFSFLFVMFTENCQNNDVSKVRINEASFTRGDIRFDLVLTQW